MKYAELLRELYSLKGKTLITLHSLGDVEAVASAIALCKLVKNSEVKSPDKTNATSRHLLEQLKVPKIQVLKKSELQKYNNTILVDVATEDMLGIFKEEIKNFRGKIIAIDHHEHGNLLKNAKIFEFPNRTSCCEILRDLYALSKTPFSPEIADLLLAGIVSDSARFKTANRGTFHAVSHLLTSGADYEKVLKMLKTAPDNSQVKNVFSALQNAVLIETKNGIIGLAKNNAFEAKTALALIEIGCVVGICFNVKGKIAMAKDSENPHSSSVNVGELMKETGREMRGSGGGHESVGGCQGKYSEKALEKLVDKTKKLLNE